MRARMRLLRSLAGLLGQGLVRLCRYVVPKPPTAIEKSFIEENAGFWAHYAESQRGKQPGKYVLVEQSDHPIIILCNASFATMVSHARKVRPLFVLNSSHDGSMRKILESYYPTSAFVYIRSWRYIMLWVLARFQAARAFRALESPEDILNFRVDGIKFGDLIYDTVLTQGYATIARLDENVLRVLLAFFVCRYVIKDIIRRYDIETSVFSHTIGLQSGIFVRYLLQNGIEVINRAGSHQIALKKYQGSDDVGVYPLRPEQRYLSHMVEKCNHIVLGLADTYLADRLNQNVRDVAVDLAFDRRKRTFGSKEEFCNHFGLDSGKKVVFVALHAFNDYPHSHFAKPMIFRDYYDWFEQTLEIAKSQPSANWIFKEHPAAGFYVTKDVNLDTLFQGARYPHIRFLNRDADFNSRSLALVADAIVTCIGTVGLEYSCMGIPCVLAGDSPYSGFGFTVEPRDAAGYEEQLRHIQELGRLHENQIKMAKIVMFFQLSMMLGTPYLFCPYYDYRQIKEIRAQDLWQDAAELMRNGDRANMRRQVETLSDFVRNPSCTQYINLDKYGFMRGA